MRQAIWKFPLNVGPGWTRVEIPAGATILSCQGQESVPVIWAVVDVDAPKTHRMFVAYPTGYEMDKISGSYIGTYQLAGGALVFHLFEVLE